MAQTYPPPENGAPHDRAPHDIAANPVAHIRAIANRLGKDPAGNTTMVMAFLLPVLIGGLAFGAEAGVWQQT